MEVTKITMEEEVVPIVSPLHCHPLVPFTRFDPICCNGCISLSYIYGGYRCNEPGCETAVFHKDCAKPLPEINHSFHPHHPLKLMIILDTEEPLCSFCRNSFKVGYCCSLCDFKLDFVCAKRREPLVIPENFYVHKHPLHLSFCDSSYCGICKACGVKVRLQHYYKCQQCEFVIHADCVDFDQEAHHTSHPQHPLKSIRSQVPDYADKKCLLCDKEFDQQYHLLQHCDVCNFSICRRCMKHPPSVGFESSRTHEHQLHLVPRLINFTCDACGTLGDRSPYLCLQCNFMIHRECIGLPRVININRHDHRISYTRRLGNGEWKCKVCRKKVDGFYGGYTCSKCPSFAVHAQCATTDDVWDNVELEGTPEEEIIEPFEVIDDNTIKHFSHDHNLKINKDGMILAESTLCVACVFQICSEPFYRCEECDFVLHKKCANLPRKKRHVHSNQEFTLLTDSQVAWCSFCPNPFTGFRYQSGPYNVTLDVRCASISDSLEHESHPHPLYYYSTSSDTHHCSRCGKYSKKFYCCDECDYSLDVECAVLSKKVMIKRYDDHPLFLSYGDMNVDEKYWCEACETKVDPKEGFYTCKDSGVVLHISCVVGDISCVMPGYFLSEEVAQVVSNTSICRKLCFVCKDRCKRPSVVKIIKAGVDLYICSFECL